MDSGLIKELSKITEEEERILHGGGVDKTLYASGHRFEVDAAKMLEKGKLMDIRVHTRFAPFPRHNHNYVEMMYMCTGKTVHCINGGKPVTLRAGELLLMNQHASHSIGTAGAGDIAVNFIVLPQFFDEAFSLIGADNVLGRFLLDALRSGGGEISYLHFQVQDILPVQNLVENMVWSLVYRQPNERRLNQVTMGLLMLQLLNHTESLSGGESDLGRYPAVVAALREIEENCQGANLSDIALSCGMALPYLSGQIRRATGHTFKELLMQKRLEKAARLLCSASLPVQEVAAVVGYNNTSYFYRIFRERFGMSPKDYRISRSDPLG